MTDHHNTPLTPTPAPTHRPIRSFVTRAGRMGSGQQRALDELGPQFILAYQEQRLDLQALHKKVLGNADTDTENSNPGKTRPVVLEIGFGMGDATAKIAQNRPDTLFLACEVHTPGIGALLRLIGAQSIPNIRILAHDAVEVLTHMIAPSSLDGIHIFFPDPWHKKRHHKRRLIQSAFVSNLAQHLKHGAYLHLATDWQPYAEQMLATLSAEPLLRNTCTDYASRPDYRPQTKFERRGLKLNHGVWDLVFTRV